MPASRQCIKVIQPEPRSPQQMHATAENIMPRICAKQHGCNPPPQMQLLNMPTAALQALLVKSHAAAAHCIHAMATLRNSPCRNVAHKLHVQSKADASICNMAARCSPQHAAKHTRTCHVWASTLKCLASAYQLVLSATLQSQLDCNQPPPNSTNPTKPSAADRESVLLVINGQQSLQTCQHWWRAAACVMRSQSNSSIKIQAMTVIEYKHQQYAGSLNEPKAPTKTRPNTPHHS